MALEFRGTQVLPGTPVTVVYILCVGGTYACVCSCGMCGGGRAPQPNRVVVFISIHSYIHSIHPRGPWPLTRAAEKEEDVVFVDMVARCRTCC